jgi:uncharacterized protein YecE (DUF72 family)
MAPFYGSQKPATFAKWHAETPDDCVFSVKAPRFATNRRMLAEAGSSIERFFASGINELKNKLGPILWQFLPTKQFDAADFEGFLQLLPRELGSRALRHVREVRHDSFVCPEFISMVRTYGIGIVQAGDSKYSEIIDRTADFSYLRIKGTTEVESPGYSEAALAIWSAKAKELAAGDNVYMYVISGFKQRNPLAAMALIYKLNPKAVIPDIR